MFRAWTPKLESWESCCPRSSSVVEDRVKVMDEDLKELLEAPHCGDRQCGAGTDGAGGACRFPGHDFTA